MGRSTRSINTGTNRLFFAAHRASERTKSEPTDWGDQITTTQVDCGSTCSIARSKRSPARICSSHQTSQPPATAVASAPHGAGAHPDHGSTTSRRQERGSALQEEVMVRTRTATTGILAPGSLGEPATTGCAVSTAPSKSDDYRADADDRAGSGPTSGGRVCKLPGGSP
jgi:hypothetical protein